MGLRGLGGGDRDVPDPQRRELGEALRERIEANLARQQQPELSAIHLVRAPSDLSVAMPRFVTAFIEQQFSR